MGHHQKDKEQQPEKAAISKGLILIAAMNHTTRDNALSWSNEEKLALENGKINVQMNTRDRDRDRDRDKEENPSPSFSMDSLLR